MSSLKKSTFTVCVTLLIGFVLFSCKQKEEEATPTPIDNGIKVLPDSLSKLGIYEGAPTDLKYNSKYIEYEGINNSFNDSCEKQDLIYVPAGKKIQTPAEGNGLPTFPSGSILLKTFYYWKDARNHALGKQLVETRVVFYNGTEWTGKSYAWNDAQNDAYSVVGGKSVPVSWINEKGKAYKFNFTIANQLQCRLCHTQTSIGPFLPIHFQMKNINMTRPWAPAINQLEYFSQKGIMNSVTANQFTTVVQYSDETQPLEKRVRSYLDTNCAHCHSQEGYAYGYSNLNLKFDVPLAETHILDGNRKEDIIIRMRSTDPKQRMPKIHSNLNDTKYIDLVEQYLKTL
jgi:hypothetical protein